MHNLGIVLLFLVERINFPGVHDMGMDIPFLVQLIYASSGKEENSYYKLTMNISHFLPFFLVAIEEDRFRFFSDFPAGSFLHHN